MRIIIKNKKRFGIVLSIVLVLTAMISGTYSLFYHENTAQSKESYSTGILSIVAKSKSDNINLTNALPMTDEEGAQTEPYVFTIENIGNLDYNFNIRLLSTSDNPIDPQYIKLKIDDGEVTTLSSLTNSVIKDNITLKAKEVMDVSIRIWLASDTPNTEIGKSFNSKIVTEGQAVYTEVNNEDGTLSNSEHDNSFNLVEHITKLYNEAEKKVVTTEAEANCTHVNAHNHCDAFDVTKTIEYNYAPDVSLMNDRLGGTTASLDGGNIRYYGDNPNNYIDIGDRDSSNEVISWRILGVFDGKIRIVRSEQLRNYVYDTSPSDINDGYGINEWSQADIMKLLNPGYENNQDLNNSNETITVNNSLWWNSGSGNCYIGRYNRTSSCIFTSSGLSEGSKKYVVDQTVYLGGLDNYHIFSNQAYISERETNVIQNSNDGITRTTSWTGKVALMYPSDFGYAADLNSCQNSIYSKYNKHCKNWLLKYKTRYTFITPDLLYGKDRVTGFIYDYYDTSNDYGYFKNFNSARMGYKDYLNPVLTLSANVIAEGDGDGTQDNPYVLR